MDEPTHASRWRPDPRRLHRQATQISLKFSYGDILIFLNLFRVEFRYSSIRCGPGPGTQDFF
jgi:hypothetical protein